MEICQLKKYRAHLVFNWGIVRSHRVTDNESENTTEIRIKGPVMYCSLSFVVTVCSSSQY